ncbi:hypothetical protein D9613_011336 [Agrocybe pediades]|uniref:Cytochrome P450 n=1 Tax=Agrocybe pediades TaxID=84607 RepID=A0A8H4QSJ2_9AGAR|nr:hypothetical protein D9613_011336 [Agrocybe pediades]
MVFVPPGVLLAASVSALVYLLFKSLFRRIKSFKSTGLRGPPRRSLILGETGYIRLSPDPKLIYKEWARQYGPVFRIALPAGSEAIIVTDSKAATQILSKDTYSYVKTVGLRAVIERLVGRGVLWAEGDEHKRQRRIMNPPFSTAALRNSVPMIYEKAHQLQAAWEALLDSEKGRSKVEVELHDWILKLLLDIVGCSIFDYDFHTLEGQTPPILTALQSLNDTKPTKLEILAYMASIFVPPPLVKWVGKLPSQRNQLMANVAVSSRDILERVLEESKKKTEVEKEDEDRKSLLRVLVEGDMGMDLSREERKDMIVTQMKAILVAGPDPVAATVVWALIELARRPDIQEALRAEIVASAGADAEWESLDSSFPFLDAVVSEIVRLRPTTGEAPRVAVEDDVLQLSEPIIDASGKVINEVNIAKGTKIIIPNHYMNSVPAIWGEDSTTFNPYRWLRKEDEQTRSRRRLYSFGDGPRMCIGRAFALMTLKASPLFLDSNIETGLTYCDLYRLLSLL